jgi:hypothetical protein
VKGDYDSLGRIDAKDPSVKLALLERLVCGVDVGDAYQEVLPNEG